MQVKVDMEEVTITLGNKGITLKIADNAGKHVGNLRIGQATVEWFPGKVRTNSKKVKLSELVNYLNTL